MRSAILSLCSALFIVSPVVASAEPPKVAASIKPVHSLAARVMQGVGEPYLVVQGAGSPHTYALKPSDATALQDADIVFWVGHNLEVFLGEAIENLTQGATVIELSEVDGITTLPVREGAAFETHEHEEDEAHQHEDDGGQEEGRRGAHGHEDEHGHEGEDAHIWLDTRNALAMVDAIAKALGEADPVNSGIYATNAAEAKAEIEALESAIADQMAPLADRPFVVFHDAYQYFEHRFGIEAAGAITVNPDVRPGAQRVRELQSKLSEYDAVCVFAEPQFDADIVGVITEGTKAQAGVLDPLGSAMEPGPGAYAAIMRSIADEAAACLGKAS